MTIRAPRQLSLGQYILKNRYMYLLVVPGFVYLVIFDYIPIYGITMAFQDFSIRRGYLGSPWVGFKHFQYLLANPFFMRAFWNMWTINLLRIALGFPMPVILALLLNEVRHMKFKRVIQTVSYLPHFISWVVLAGIFNSLLSRDLGPVNHLISMVGLPRIDFLQDNRYFRGVLIATDIWKNIGWGTIIYLASIAAINPELYESAIVDGAGRWKQMLYITLPSISSTIIVLLVLRMGAVLNEGFDQIYNMYNPLVYETSDIIHTYIVRNLSTDPNFSRLTAAGLIRSLIGMVLLLSANRTVRFFGREAIY